MKTFKIILILILLFTMSVFASYNQPVTQGKISDWQESIGTYGGTKDTLEWNPNEYGITYITSKEEPNTLLEWFKSLTLDEKVEIYNWWNNRDNTNLIFCDDDIIFHYNTETVYE